ILIREMRSEMAASILRRVGTVVRAGSATPPSESLLDEPVAEDAAKAALEAADANPPPPDGQPAPAPPKPPLQ
ncbi:MAG TPA: hypothetical protein VJ484_04720, partial [Lysobacter sp.]|nr:hypothetical protein [Lysobacter sp.]